MHLVGSGTVVLANGTSYMGQWLDGLVLLLCSYAALLLSYVDDVFAVSW